MVYLALNRVLPYGRRARGCAPRRHASEQYKTRSQSRSHFLRHTTGRAQAAQILEGSSDFFIVRYPCTDPAEGQCLGWL